MVFFTMHNICSLLFAGCLILALEPTATATAAQECGEGPDVVLVRQIGTTKYVDKPITIVSQDSTEVTFELSQEWKDANGLDDLFIRFKDAAFDGSPKCYAYDAVDYKWTGDAMTAVCTKNSKLAFVEVWAADASFDQATDKADLPDCSCGAPTNEDFPMVKYVFTVECAPACSNCLAAPSSAPSTAPTDALGPCPVGGSLNGVCGPYALHAYDAITFASGELTRVVGDVGVSPGTSITGPYTVAAGGQTQANSDAYAASVWGSGGAYELAMAIRTDEDLMGPADAVEIGGRTFKAGTHRAKTALNFAAGTTITLDAENDPDAEFLFQASSTLTTGANTYFHMVNGAKAENVIWALGTAATLGANSVLEGSILAGTAITFGTMSELRGCGISQTAVTFDKRGYVNVRLQTDVTVDDTGSPTCTAVVASSCENFALHARDTITFAGTQDSVISNGDVGVSPGTAITGNYHIVNGALAAVEATETDFAMFAMFNHADKRSRRTDDETYWGIPVYEIGDKTYLPGTYSAGSSINFAFGTTVTLDGGGDLDSKFLFQAVTTLTTAADTKFILQNGAQAQNVIWALGTAATLGESSILEGSLLAGTAITFGIHAKVNGCSVAMTAITFESEGYVDVP
jgi:hypothetical protein